MIFPELTNFVDFSLLLLRIVVAVVFITSGWSHFTQPAERSKSIEMSVQFTFLLGLGEFLGGISVLLGIYIQLSSILLILIMLGAIGMKIFRWKIGFNSSNPIGWHYDLLFLSANAVFLCTGGGNYVLLS